MTTERGGEGRASVPSWLAAVRRRFRSETWPTRAHVRTRSASAPLVDVVAAVGRRGLVVDIGCGHGLVAMALAHGAPRRVLAVDIDERKVEVARRAAARAPALDGIELRVVEAGWSPPPADAVILADVLYLMEPDAQADYLGRCAAAVRPGGVLVVKEVDDAPRWKAGVVHVQEQIAVRSITRRAGRALAPPPARAVEAWMRTAGLEPTTTRLDRFRPWPHYLTVGHRP